MSVDLKLEVKSETVSKKFRLPKSLVDEFDLYLEAARETEPGADQNAVLQAILLRHFGKDKSFQDWRKVRKARPARTGTPTSSPARPSGNARNDDTSPGTNPPARAGG